MSKNKNSKKNNKRKFVSMNDEFNISDSVFSDLPSSFHFLYNLKIHKFFDMNFINKDLFKNYENSKDLYNEILSDLFYYKDEPMSFFSKYLIPEAYQELKSTVTDFEIFNENKKLVLTGLIEEANYHLWKQNGKIELCPDKDFVKRLKDVKITKNLLIALKSLPYETFIVNTRNLFGEATTNKTSLGITRVIYMMVNYNKKSEILSITYRLVTNLEKFDCITKDSIKNTIGGDTLSISLSEKNFEILINSKEDDCVKVFLSIIAYIGCINSDIKQIPDKQIRIPSNLKTKIKPKEFIIGETIGTAIRKHNQEQKVSTYLEGNGSSKMSHIRRAHFHHYWQGSGENRKLVVKWLDPIFVNCDNNEEKKKLPIKRRKVTSK